MRTNKYLAAVIAFISVILTACGGGDSDDPKPAQQTLILRSQSISDNATVDAATVKSVVLNYNNLIQVDNSKNITLNGTKVNAKANGMDLIVDVELENWKTYQLVIPAGAVAIKDNLKVTAPETVINFDTKYGRDPSAPTKVAEAPVNPKATAEAKALYQLLKDNYGNKMFSGAMGGIGWETTYTDLIYKETGSYPTVVGFDYLHLPSSPANWIDYGDITPVKTVHDRGCIVEIGWHWNVPKSENSTEISFSTTGVTFNAANVLVEGTWENKVAVADIKKLAGYLKLLQDAKIPVLWRPLHEAAGDYKWGPWFWWGNQGVEVTKKLWYYLYDQLTNVYGLNNLIWVWTVQTSSEGKPASVSVIQAAYPGDDYVDIVGCDLYPDKALTDQSAQYDLVYQTVNGNKMVALTECGNLVDPDKAFANNALWSYFMQWYDYKDGRFGHFNYNGPDIWNTVMQSPYVISTK